MSKPTAEHSIVVLPAVTVFMPVYNAMPYLPEAVESIRRQTLRDWSFLIVDDGSTDGSAEYIEQLDDPRIRILRQPHQGPAVAANRALALCETEFFARMDADDVSHPTRLEQQLAFLCRHPETGLLGTQIEPLGTLRTGRPSRLATDHRTILADLMRGRHAMCNPTIMCRTSLLREVGGYHADGVLEDWAMFLSMGQRAELANLDRVLLSYRIHAESTNNRHMAELRTRIAFVCDRARRQQARLTQIGYDEFLALRRVGPFWRRTAQGMEGHAMAQYRIAQVDILGPRRLRGYARLAWAAACSPPLTLQRIARTARRRLLRRSGAGPDAAWPTKDDQAAGNVAEPAWPPKHDLFGVRVSATDYEEATGVILDAARRRRSGVVSLHAVHALMTAAGDPALRDAVNTFDMVGPDGQPVRWALRLVHGVRLRERVYGPELMLRLCERAAAERVPIYLYGALPETIRALHANLVTRYPRLVVAGAESPPFRPLSDAELEQTIRRIESSGAGIVFLGLGAPKQDWFAYRHRQRIRAVQVCVGAAFDFHAGNKRTAPQWMQRRGLEWLFRLCCEPRRLWRRYLMTNSLFLGKLTVALLRRRRHAPHAPPPASHGARPVSAALAAASVSHQRISVSAEGASAGRVSANGVPAESVSACSYSDRRHS
ncbi:MAG: WecB/TagA/CpsF family glycosyltransferase [Pirellulales bacterium]|nr:WecB/TagA/CpsF family glycosyltransferase [Pirellulales bacterium]